MKPIDVDETVLAQRAKIVAALRRIVPGEGVIAQEIGRRGLSIKEAPKTCVKTAPTPSRWAQDGFLE